MGAISSKPGDIAIWIEKVIDSCETPIQINASRKLIGIFETRLLEINSPDFAFFSRKLRNTLDNKPYIKIK